MPVTGEGVPKENGKPLFMQYEQEYPELAMEFMRRASGQLRGDFLELADEYIQSCVEKAESIASRKASQNSIASFGAILPELIGGSADLTGSNLTSWAGSEAITLQANGNYIYYGVREFGMFAINNGIALHGGFVPYGGTFLVFMEYARNAARMAALMKQQSIMVFTHDSIGQGEDGPTHQPVEQLANLRMTPNMSVWRPADSVETAVAWKAAIMKQDGPSSLVFSRQGLGHLARTQQQIGDIARGGYILCDCEGTPDIIVIATGSKSPPVWLQCRMPWLKAFRCDWSACPRRMLLTPRMTRIKNPCYLLLSENDWQSKRPSRTSGTNMSAWMAR